MERTIPFDTELPCSPRLLREVAWWKGSPRQVYSGSAEAAHGQIQRNCFSGGYLGGRQEQPQAAAGAVGLQGCTCRTPTMNSCQPLIPPDPAAPLAQPQPSQSSPKSQINSGSSLQPSPPGMVSRWVQDFSGAPAEKPEGKLRITLSP